jgi:hypothetical protein
VVSHEGGLGQVAGEGVTGESSDEDLFGGICHAMRPSGWIVARLGRVRHEKGANGLAKAAKPC